MDFDKLVNLWPFPRSRELLTYLSENGVIAGGSIVYSTNDFVPQKTVGDIDVFVHSEKIKEVLKELEGYPCQHYTFISPNVYFEGETVELGTEVSILHIPLGNGCIPLQIIIQDYDTPMDVIESFDLDYVQCGYSAGKLWKTDICVRSHESREVRMVVEVPASLKRLDKAYRKKFKVCMIGEKRNDVQLKPVETSPTFAPIKRRKSSTVTKICISNITVQKILFLRPKEIYEGMVKIYPSRFICQVDDEKWEQKLVPIRVKILEKEYESRQVIITPVIIGPYEVSVCRMMEKFFLDIGKTYTLLVDLYFTQSRAKFGIYGKYQHNRARPIVFSEYLEIKKDPGATIPNLKHTLDIVNVDTVEYIKARMKEIEYTESDSVWIKYQAYSAFMYKYTKNTSKKEKERIYKAVRYAASQMKYDRLKMMGYTPSYLGPDATNCETIKDLVKYVEH